MNLSLEATLTSIHPSLGPSPPSPKGKRGEKERREDDGDDEDGSICETSDDVASSPQSQRLAQSGTSVDSARAATAVQWPESAFHFCVLQRNWRFARRRAANCRRCTVQKAPSREIWRCKSGAATYCRNISSRSLAGWLTPTARQSGSKYTQRRAPAIHPSS